MNPRKRAERRLLGTQKKMFSRGFVFFLVTPWAWRLLDSPTRGRTCAPFNLSHWTARKVPGTRGEDVESRKLGNLAGGAFPRQNYRSERLPGCDVCTCELWETEFNPVQPTAGAGPLETKLRRETPSLMLRTGPHLEEKGGFSQHSDRCAWHSQDVLSSHCGRPGSLVVGHVSLGASGKLLNLSESQFPP